MTLHLNFPFISMEKYCLTISFNSLTVAHNEVEHASTCLLFVISVCVFLLPFCASHALAQLGFDLYRLPFFVRFIFA